MPFNGKRGGEFRERAGFPEGHVFGAAVLAGRPERIAEPHAPDWGKVSFVG